MRKISVFVLTVSVVFTLIFWYLVIHNDMEKRNERKTAHSFERFDFYYVIREDIANHKAESMENWSDDKSGESEFDESANETEQTERDPTEFVKTGDVITDFLCEKLDEFGILWWQPYAAAQIFQESGRNIGAVSNNGLDRGLLQYRITYWPAVCEQHGFPGNTDIFDWRVQICIYVADTARRLNSGCSIEETISRHKMSDFGQYDALYVQHVLRWVR